MGKYSRRRTMYVNPPRGRTVLTSIFAGIKKNYHVIAALVCCLALLLFHGLVVFEPEEETPEATITDTLLLTTIIHLSVLNSHHIFPAQISEEKIHPPRGPPDITAFMILIIAVNISIPLYLFSFRHIIGDPLSSNGTSTAPDIKRVSSSIWHSQKERRFALPPLLKARRCVSCRSALPPEDENPHRPVKEITLVRCVDRHRGNDDTYQYFCTTNRQIS